MKFGFHLSISGGLHRAAMEAGRLKTSCLQIFSGNPRGWAQKEISPEQAQRFQRAARESGLELVAVHAPYLINLASPDNALWQKSVKAFADQLQRAHMIGARAVVVHPGSRGGKPLEWGVKRVAEGVRNAVEMSPGQAACWLENTAGGGAQMGGSLSQLAAMLDALPGLPMGACLDTAHAWGAGYALDRANGVLKFLSLIEKKLGLERVALWHLNDTVVARGSKRDQHCHLGKGFIGAEGFQSLLCDPRLAGAYGVMETPKDSPWADRRNLAFAHRLSRGCR